jgi:hypothetical protein
MGTNTRSYWRGSRVRAHDWRRAALVEELKPWREAQKKTQISSVL